MEESGELSQLDPSYSKSGLGPAKPASSGNSARKAASQPPLLQGEMDQRWEGGEETSKKTTQSLQIPLE